MVAAGAQSDENVEKAKRFQEPKPELVLECQETLEAECAAPPQRFRT